MKTLSLFATPILLILPFSTFGQETLPKPIKKISVTDVYIQTGFNSEQNISATLLDFKMLAPQSALLGDNLTDFSSFGGYDRSNNTMFSVLLGLQFSDKQKSSYRANPRLRLGFSYVSGTMLTGGLYHIDRQPYDTLTSAQTGQTAYVDSVTTQRYSMFYSSEQIRFDASLIFRTNPEARWSLFTGIGMNTGLSINANTEIYYSIYNRSETRFGNSITSTPNNFFNANDDKKELHRNKTNIGSSVYIPMGIDFRLGSKKEFWKRAHVFYELRPAINVTSIPELRTIATTSLQHGLGLRVTWN